MAHSKLSLLSAALVVVLGSYSATGIAAPQDAPYPNQAPTNAPTLARGGNVNYSIDYAAPAPAPPQLQLRFLLRPQLPLRLRPLPA